MTQATQAGALVERVGNVMVITINRPEARNAVNSSVSIGVGGALEEAANDPDVRAIVVTGAGGPEVMAYDERPDPEPGAGEVLVAATHAGLNPADLMQRAGHYPAPPGSPAPVLLRWPRRCRALGSSRLAVLRCCLEWSASCPRSAPSPISSATFLRRS